MYFLNDYQAWAVFCSNKIEVGLVIYPLKYTGEDNLAFIARKCMRSGTELKCLNKDMDCSLLLLDYLFTLILILYLYDRGPVALTSWTDYILIYSWSVRTMIPSAVCSKQI